MSMLKKIFRAIKGLPRNFSTTPQPKIIMTLLVKDEEEMLEENLLFHRSMGVDAFIITDNNSTDRTPEIIGKYQKKGWVVEFIRETGTNYAQKKWVDRMVQAASVKHKADWIINADADEFWYYPGGFKPLLAQTRANVLMCDMRNVYPEEGLRWSEWDKTVREVKDTDAYDLSLYSIFSRHRGKVMHRANGYLQIAMGNHKVLMLCRRKAHCDILIYHYTVRDKAYFLRKMINGGKQLEQNPKKHGGRHWRYYYQLYKENKLAEEYDRVIGANDYDKLCHAGHIVEDCPMPQLLRSLVP